MPFAAVAYVVSHFFDEKDAQTSNRPCLYARGRVGCILYERIEGMAAIDDIYKKSLVAQERTGHRDGSVRSSVGVFYDVNDRLFRGKLNSTYRMFIKTGLACALGK